MFATILCLSQNQYLNQIEEAVSGVPDEVLEGEPGDADRLHHGQRGVVDGAALHTRAW